MDYLEPNKLSLRPKDLIMAIYKRDAIRSLNVQQQSVNAEVRPLDESERGKKVSLDSVQATWILYGSNNGSSEEFARRLFDRARNLGSKHLRLLSLDQWIESYLQAALMTEKRQLIVIVT